MQDRTSEMRLLRDAGWKLQQIANRYGISRERVRQIIGNTGVQHKYPRLRKEELFAVRKHYRYSTTEIADLYSVSRSYIISIMGNVGHISKYPPGYRKCSGDCKKVLPTSKFYSLEDRRCKNCAMGRNSKLFYLQKRAANKIHQLLQYGKLKKQDCLLKSPNCHGRIEAHHYLGYEREHWTHVQWLCSRHHDVVEKFSL